MYESVGGLDGQAVLPDVAGLLDRIATNDAARRQLDADQAGLIAEVCDRWQVDETAADLACERLIEGGAAGTTLVGEYLAYELGPILRVSPTTAGFRIADVLNLRDRHPQLWQLVQNLHVEFWQATKVTRATRHLTIDAAGWVDRQICIALQVMPFRRVLNTLPDLITRADPALAAEREAADRHRRMVTIGHYHDGGGTVWARLAAGDADHLNTTISELANRLLATETGANLTCDQRRAVALGLLAEPERAATLLAGGDMASVRRSTVFVHLPAGAVITDQPGAVATIEGIGALTRDSLTEFLGTTKVTVRPVVDHNQIPAVDSYQTPPIMREAVTQQWPVEAFPWATRRSRGTDLDHSTPYHHTTEPGTRQTGQTRQDNLAPLTRRAHRARTNGGWQLHQPEPGIINWTSRHGYHYQVTPHGTTNHGRPQHRDQRPGPPDPRPPEPIPDTPPTRPPEPAPDTPRRWPVDITYPKTPIHYAA